jgi:hypothetical protein
MTSIIFAATFDIIIATSFGLMGFLLVVIINLTRRGLARVDSTRLELSTLSRRDGANNVILDQAHHDDGLRFPRLAPSRYLSAASRRDISLLC